MGPDGNHGSSLVVWNAGEIAPSQRGPGGGVVALEANQEWEKQPLSAGDESRSGFPSAGTMKLLQHRVHKALG